MLMYSIYDKMRYANAFIQKENVKNQKRRGNHEDKDKRQMMSEMNIYTECQREGGESRTEGHGRGDLIPVAVVLLFVDGENA